MKSLKGIYNNQPNKCNQIAMSATFRQSNQDVISNLFEQTPDKIMWLELLWQGIHFDGIISGSPSTSIPQSLVQDYKFPMQIKTIIYANSKKQALGTITNAMENVIQQSPNFSEVIPLTGDDGLQFKVFTMHAFVNNNESPDEEVAGNGGPFSLLPNLTIMPATKAADFGVSSKFC